MLTKEENDLLCRVGPERPMGRMMRRYWLPMLLSSDLDRDGDPKRVRLLGEDLVAFRDDAGQIGLLDERCPHRRASLVLGRNENGALECLYHGWRIHCSGKILDTPVEPEDSTFKDRIRATAYKTCEAGGAIWAYLGPAALEPAKPSFHFTQIAPNQVMIIRAHTRTNWAQGLEGVIDSAHTLLLHQDNVRPRAADRTLREANGVSHRPSVDTRPTMKTEDTSYGFRYGAIRRPIVDSDLQKYVRVSLFIAPIFAMFPQPEGWVWMQGFTPIDDEHTIFWAFQASDSPIPDDRRKATAERSRMRPGIDLDDQLRPLANRSNNWHQDREAMRRGESHTGIVGINQQDFAVQESMGATLDRSKEHLGVSDTAIIRFRRRMIDAVRLFEQGAEPPGLRADIPFSDLRAEERILPTDADWQTVGAIGA